MNYLQLVNEAIAQSGALEDSAVTLVGATGIVADFKRWVRDSWRELQEESYNWYFRQKINQTLTLSASDDTYNMPSGLMTLNYRTVTCYTTVQEDESAVEWEPYEDWHYRNRTATSESKPLVITEAPDGTLRVWPVPDQEYTLKFDGVYDIDILSADADVPGTSIASARTLPERYDWYIVWDAVRRYAAHHEDGPKHAEAQANARSHRNRLSEQQMPPIKLRPFTYSNVSRRSSLY